MSRSSFVGSLAKGCSGMRVSDKICWPATPNLVKQRSFKAWCHVAQLSLGRSRMMVIVRVVGVESMFNTISNCQVCGQKTMR